VKAIILANWLHWEESFFRADSSSTSQEIPS
jgi:hypothetical protein